MKKFIFIMFILINSNNLFAQKEFTNWIFGYNSGITFNTPDLKPINIVGSRLSTWEGCCSISDKNGNLLFYSDGTNVWNKNNEIMPNGINLKGYYSASQSCIVVQNPADQNQYYLFTIDGVENNQNGLTYSIVDMTLDNGLGDVISSKKNIKLIDNTVENICTVRHFNKQDIWIINYCTHQNSFFVFLLTKNGVNKVPVKSPGYSIVSAAAGYSIKSSKSGSMVAYANQRTGSVEVYDFDNNNGTLKKKYNIKTPSDWAYAVEFSPNERFLYASVFLPCKLIQYDLSLADETKISQNGNILANNNSATFYYGLIQIAPDNKIYIAKDGSKYLATIDLPDELGKKCNYVDNAFLLTGQSGLGLPNYSINEYYSNIINCADTGPELISNGSFDNDFDGFYSDYVYLKDPPWATNGVYTITNDPHSFMSPWVTFDDISPSANGKMFLTDAGGNVNSVLIGTNVSVKNNTKYIFSLWAARVNDYNPPEIKVYINNVLQISKTLSEMTGIWANVEFEWNSSTDTNAKIEIFDANPILYGNDFVIDEISFRECLPVDSVLKITSNAPICEGADLLLFTDSIANAQYHWYGPNGFKSEQQNPILSNVKSSQSGKYYLYVTVGNVNSDTISIDVSVSTFQVTPGDSSLIFVGTASKIDNYIKLTDPKIWDGGSIWLKNRFSVKQDFVTTFKFRTRFGDDRVTPDGSLPGADGLAFVMQNHNYPVLGVTGGSIGYTGITNSLAIEFDLYQNPWDPNGNHIAVQSMGAGANQPDHTKYNSCMGIASNIITIKQDSIYYSKIEYEWANKTLKIYLDSTGKFESPALTIPNIDLSSYLQLEEGEYVYIGFTAGTGESYQEHDLFDWTIPCKNQLVDVEEKNFINNKSEKLEISPNPASNSAVISYDLDKVSNVSLMIINTYGQEISKPFSNRYQNTGTFRYNLETSSLAEGVYLVILQKGSERISKLLLIMK